MAIKFNAKHFSQVNKRDNVYLISNDFGFTMQKWLRLSSIYRNINKESQVFRPCKACFK